jgi:D-alanyl-D-alanine dipeptidase
MRHPRAAIALAAAAAVAVAGVVIASALPEEAGPEATLAVPEPAASRQAASGPDARGGVPVPSQERGGVPVPLQARGGGPAASRRRGGVASASRAGARRPARFPPRAHVRAARDWIRGRTGASFALIDTRGRVYGWDPRRRYVSASVVKAMLLVAFLRGLGGSMPGPSDQEVLGPMIRWSDNDAADAIYGRVGDTSLLDLAQRAHMRDLTVAGHWGGVYFSAADLARFFRRFGRLVPRASRDYARDLLSSIVPGQRWGFSRFAGRAGWRTYFKGGWRRTEYGRLVHEAAQFQRGRRTFSLAVLSDGNPSHEYGTATLRGVAKRIFEGEPHARSARAQAEAGSPAHRRAGLVDVQRFGPGIALDIVYAGKDNLTGGRLPGYCRAWALMLEPAARDLGRVQRYLRRRNRGLLVLDAYRPARASRALVRWAERTGRAHLVGTYIARRSRHNLGSAVDLTLVRASDGRRLRMGRYDALGPGAHTLDARGAVLRNRLQLVAAMERFGFTNYWREWWHYEHRVTGATYLDIPLGCGRP